MEEYNAVKNSSRYFRANEPIAQQKAAEAERAEILDQVPLLKDILKRLEKRMSETDSNKVTRAIASKYNLDPKDAMALQEIVHDILAAERNFIEGKMAKLKKP